MQLIVKYFYIITITFGIGYSQSLQENLKSMANANAKNYLGASVTAFGMNMNSSIFHTAKTHKVLGFDLKMNISITSTSDAPNTFDFILPSENILVPVTIGAAEYDLEINPDLVYEEDRVSSTMFGPKISNEIMVNDVAAKNNIRTQLANQGATSSAIDQIPDSELTQLVNEYFPILVTPEGLDISFTPMIIPQISIGLPKDIELTLRGLPSGDAAEFGKLQFLGYGGKIGLNQFIPLPNIVLPDMAFGYYSTNLNMGDIIKMNNSIAMIQISKSIPFITLYGGLGLESSSMDLNYSYTDALSETPTPIKFSITGKNTFRTIIGFRLKLAILSVNADYNIGAFNTVNVGLGLTLR